MTGHLAIFLKMICKDGEPKTPKTLTYDDVNEEFIGELATYFATEARCRSGTRTGEPITVQCATNYMSSFKMWFIHTHCRDVDVPPCLKSPEMWSRKMGQILAIKANYCRQHNIQLYSRKDAVTEDDRIAMGLVCLWNGDYTSAESLHFINSTVQCVGRYVHCFLLCCIVLFILFYC